MLHPPFLADFFPSTVRPHSCPEPTPQRHSPAGVFELKEEIEDKSLAYPSYYTRAFHGAFVPGGKIR